MSEKPIYLYTYTTPNGYPISILLEELKAVYPGKIDYDYEKLDISTNVQKEDWFIKINPNGRIPAIIDKARNNFNVFETSAILLYIAQHYDPQHKFSFDPVTEPDNYSELLQWLFFVHGGVGPMQGQAHHFLRIAPEEHKPYGLNRESFILPVYEGQDGAPVRIGYLNETKRLYGVLDIRLKNRDYLAGSGRGKYSLADMKAWPWVRIHAVATIPTLDEFPNVKAWVERIGARPHTQTGASIPPSKQ